MVIGEDRCSVIWKKNKFKLGNAEDITIESSFRGNI